jgi:hypothetical protein
MMVTANDQLKTEFETTRRRVNAPCFVGLGWQPIVIDAVAKIDWLERRDSDVRVDWQEIKEWNGTLAMRFELLGANDDNVVVGLIRDVVAAAKLRADKTCVVCGEESDGEFEFKGDTLRVLCMTHRDEA